MDRRPCVIDGEIQGYFHGFSTCDHEYLKINMIVNEHYIADFELLWKTRNVIPYGCEVVKVSKMYAVIERLNGTIELITPVDRIRFTDME